MCVFEPECLNSAERLAFPKVGVLASPCQCCICAFSTCWFGLVIGMRFVVFAC